MQQNLAVDELQFKKSKKAHKSLAKTHFSP